MDIKKYEVLLSTLDKGCFAKACEDLGYTQPAITHMMKSMEREIGFPLLKRSNKGIQLTSEGREVLPLIRELVAANDRLNKYYDMLRGVETGSVRVGTFPTVGGAWLPRIIAQFEKKYPQIQIDVLEENSIHKIEEWLTGGRIDVAFFARQPYHTFDWIPLKMDPYYGILPLEHELTSYDRLTAADFENQPFLMCCSMEGPDLDITRFFQQDVYKRQAHFLREGFAALRALARRKKRTSIYSRRCGGANSVRRVEYDREEIPYIWKPEGNGEIIPIYGKASLYKWL